MSFFSKKRVWMRNQHDFARRFDEADLRGIFSKKVTMEQGTKALILQGGVYCGFLPSGVYTFGDLSTRLGLNLEKHTTIIIVDAGEVSVPFSITKEDNLRTKDSISVCAKVSLLVKIDDPSLFLENYLKHTSSISLLDIEKSLHRDVAVSLASIFSQYRAEELSGNADLQHHVKKVLKEETGIVTAGMGIEVCSVNAVVIDLGFWNSVVSEKERGNIEVAKVDAQVKTGMRIRGLDAVNQIDRIETAAAIKKAEADAKHEAENREAEHANEIDRMGFDHRIAKVKSLIELRDEKQRREIEAWNRCLIDERENERLILDNYSNASVYALISFLGANNPNVREIAKLELAKRGVSLTPEQISAVQAGYSDAVADAMKESYAYRGEVSSAEKTEKIYRDFSDKEERIFSKGLDAMSRVATAKASSSGFDAERNRVRYVKCPHCGEFNVETETYCVRCRQRLY